MKKLISKVLVVVMVFSVLCFYQAKPSKSAKVYADDVETTEESTTSQETTVPETTTAPVKKTPADVTKLKVSDKKTTSLKVSWKKSDLATSYIVYRSKEQKSKMSSFKKYKTITSTSFKDTGLTQATVYKYKVVAYRNADGYVTSSSGKVVSTMTLPSPVQSFKGKPSSKQVKLTWTKNSKANNYIIYRATERNGKFGSFKKIKTLSKKKNTFTNKKLASSKFYKFKIVVYRKKFGVKASSTGKVITVMTTLAKPTKLKSSEKSTSITLKWKKVTNANYYEVYQGKKLVKTTKDVTYTRTGLKKRHTYKFKVRAVRKYKGKTYKSGFAKITAATTIGGVKGTWVEISIKSQTLKMYVKNKLYVKTAVVTGNVGDRHTTKGRHKVIAKAKNKRLKGSYRGQSWDVRVNYWLQFTSDAQGIHDSTWRSAYGGNIYKTNGSHGCVNTPLKAMKKIYKKAYVGMPVIVY